MCYQYNRDFRRDIKKDASQESEERPEPRVEAKDFKFWAFPRRSREFTVEEPATVDRTREKV
ncbi:hypothetical protein E5206_06585 [Arthrobacter sp. PAMC25564]|uniref:hypothetical protein n=1 Tax=Arthrobacter sp. PAMC25564 TaxID=2565366 RepID=UPI0010A2655D|nr:hypothetical protein [Arthrobacter sp. PAMC25564]QCB96637.1 hypothetical protein E5206_06585 [Arthrobacter sp. PAMC25564]